MQALAIFVAFEAPSDKVLGKRGAAMLAQLKSLAGSLGYHITSKDQALILVTLQAGSDENLSLRIANLKSERFYSGQISFVRQSIDVLGSSATVNRALGHRRSMPEKILSLVEAIAQH